MSLFGGFGLIFRDYVGLEGVVYRKYLQAQWVLPTTLFWDCWDTVSFFFWQMRNQVRLLVHTDLIDSNMSFQAVELLCAKFALPDYVVIPKKLESKTWLKPSETLSTDWTPWTWWAKYLYSVMSSAYFCWCNSKSIICVQSFSSIWSTWHLRNIFLISNDVRDTPKLLVSV